jgi:hypothetical protein
MANVNAPFGFADSHRLGAAVNYQMSRRWIYAGNGTAIFTGDPIIQLQTGYIAVGAPASGTTQTQIGGIFCGCEYMSISQKKWVASPFWPGSDAVAGGTGFDVMAKIIDDPAMVFRVQVNGYPGALPAPGTPPAAVLGTIGCTATFAIGTGNTVTGKSGATIDVVTNPPVPGTANPAWPFKIIDVVRDPPGSNGADLTTPYYWVYVTFNNQDYKSLQGI